MHIDSHQTSTTLCVSNVKTAVPILHAWNMLPVVIIFFHLQIPILIMRVQLLSDTARSRWRTLSSMMREASSTTLLTSHENCCRKNQEIPACIDQWFYANFARTGTQVQSDEILLSATNVDWQSSFEHTSVAWVCLSLMTGHPAVITLFSF